MGEGVTVKLSIIVPVYNEADNLILMYNELKEKVLNIIDYDYELIMVNDGSKDDSLVEMKKIADIDPNVKLYSLSKNFGEWSAVLCGLSKCTGDCAVYKSADMQEPSEMMVEMVESWKKGNNVILACRSDRVDGFGQKLLAKIYYGTIRKIAHPNMPKNGYNVFLIDRKVIDVIKSLDITNNSFVCQLLSLGFKTDYVYYIRPARRNGKSSWTFRKKVRLSLDVLYSSTTMPIKLITATGSISIIGSVILAIYCLIQKFGANIDVDSSIVAIFFNLLTFGITMISIGAVGGYAWRILKSSRNCPQYVVEEEYSKNEIKK